MNRYLVVSYDPDQQQWFYDVVFAASAEAATAKLLAVRTYCEDADALTMGDVAHFAASVPNVTPEQSEADLADFAREIGVADLNANYDDTFDTDQQRHDAEVQS